MDDTNHALSDLKHIRIGGTEVHYYVLCPRKLWWFSHGIEQEHVSGGQGAENVALGQQIHQDAYPAQKRKDVLIDDLLRLDFTDQGVVHEIKKSRGGLAATRMQLLYYLYYLKHEKGVATTGMIDFPKERTRESVVLTPEREREVEGIVAGIQAVRAAASPPPVVKPLTICKKCAYQDLCWG